MASKDDIVVAFDFYGTLVSPDSVIGQLSDEFRAARAPEISSLWRRYQLEYTWRLNSMSACLELNPLYFQYFLTSSSKVKLKAFEQSPSNLSYMHC